MKICHDILNTLNFTFDHKITGCCLQLPDNTGRIPYWDYKIDDGVPTLDDILERRESYINQMQCELPRECVHCPYITLDYSQVRKIARGLIKPSFTRLIFEWDTKCNANCGYCDIKNSDKTSNWDYMVPLFNEIIEFEEFDKHGDVLISGGEPSIINEFNYIIDTLELYSKHLRYHLFSTLITRSERFTKLFEESRLDILVSLDATCPETYKVIKGVDRFNKVIENIQYYAQINPDLITVKMIISNDNHQEVEQFINLMLELGITHVMWDFPRPDYPSNDIINAIRKFISLAHTNKLHYIGMYHGGIYNNVDDIIKTNLMVPFSCQ